MTKRYLTIPAVVAGALASTLGLGAASVFAQGTQPTTAELMKQIESLQAKVQNMETQQQTMSTKAVDDTVARVLQDADRRSQLMQMEGFTAGWSNGRFMLGSTDGAFTFMPSLLLQVRSVSNYDSANDGNSSSGFEIARARLGFDGKIFRDWQYMIRWDSGQSDGGGAGSANLADAWIQHSLSDQFSIRTGQFVNPIFREQLVDSGMQLAVDRSLLNSIITGASLTYTEGVALNWNPDTRMDAVVAYTNGANSQNTNFQDFPVGKANFGLVGRFEFAFMGTVNSPNYNQFTSMGDKDESLIMGAAVDWTQAGDTNLVDHTIDIQWNAADGKWALYGAFVGQWINNGGGSGITGVTAVTDNDSYNYGLLVQAGYMLDQNWELFGRYDYMKLDDAIAVGTAAGTADTFNEATFGVNYYFHGHNAKWTADVSWVDNAPQGTTQIGVVSSDDNQFIFRTQLQLML